MAQPTTFRKSPNAPSTQRLYPRQVQEPIPAYNAKHHRPPVSIPTSWTTPTDEQTPPAINLPTYSFSLLGRENIGLKGTIRKRSSLRTILEILAHVLYHFFLLSLPTLYTSRVTRIFKQVDVSMAEIKKSVLEISAQAQSDEQIFGLTGFTTVDLHDVPLLHRNLKHAWDSFIDSLMRDWRMLNVISILLLSAIVAILQIQSAADDPFTRFSGSLSLICVFISVSYGCMYSIQFDSMRETRKAVEWTLEAQNTKTSTFWNVHTLLAMPLIWLAWSILLYLVCFLSFVWRTGTTTSTQSPPTVTAHDILGPRIIISAIIALGLTCFILIFTTFRRYGDAMDDAWNLRVKSWLLEAEYRAHQQG